MLQRWEVSTEEQAKNTLSEVAMEKMTLRVRTLDMLVGSESISWEQPENRCNTLNRRIRQTKEETKEIKSVDGDLVQNAGV